MNLEQGSRQESEEKKEKVKVQLNGRYVRVHRHGVPQYSSVKFVVNLESGEFNCDLPEWDKSKEVSLSTIADPKPGELEVYKEAARILSAAGYNIKLYAPHTTDLGRARAGQGGWSDEIIDF